MLKLLAIAAGGALGALLRYGLTVRFQAWTGHNFPSGTLLVNTLGCLAIGFLAAAVAGPVIVREETRAFLVVGLLGAFTTFSTYGFETLALASGGELRLAFLNVALSNALGLAGVWVGLRLGALLGNA